MERKYELISVSVDDLYLDTQNPRLYRIQTENLDRNIEEKDLIEYLRTYDNLDKLKNEIKREGWEPTNEPWIIEKTGKYIVKEGNRRISALKLLKQNGEKIPESIDVKLYQDEQYVLKLMTKEHTIGEQEWDTWADALNDRRQNLQTEKAHLLGFILRHELNDILYHDCYTVFSEILVASKSKDIIGIWLDKKDFHYESLKNAKFVLQELLTAFINGKLNTRKREDYQFILEGIADRLPDKNKNSIGNSNLFMDSNNNMNNNTNMQANNPSASTNSQSGSPKIRDFKTEKIDSWEDMNNFFDKILKEFGNKLRGTIEKPYQGYGILKELSQVNDRKSKRFPTATISLIRALFDAIVFQLSNSKDEAPVYLQKLKDNKKEDITHINVDIDTYTKEHYQTMSAIIHGQQKPSSEKEVWTYIEKNKRLLIYLLNKIE